MSGHHFHSFKEYLQHKFNEGPFLATDIIIEYHNDRNIMEGIVLIERLNKPYGLALPGGIAEYLTLPENARKEAKEETGLDLEFYNSLDPQPFRVESDPEQDPRAFIVSVSYQAICLGQLKAGDDAKKAQVFDRDELEKLITLPNVWAMPHHRKILQHYLHEKWRVETK